MKSPHEMLAERARELRTRTWRYEKWQLCPALFSKEPPPWGKKYFGEPYDSDKWELVEAGWGHDHCEFCGITISEEEYDQGITDGYTDGNNWICPKCFQRVIVQGKDIFTR